MNTVLMHACRSFVTVNTRDMAVIESALSSLGIDAAQPFDPATHLFAAVPKCETCGGSGDWGNPYRDEPCDDCRGTGASTVIPAHVLRALGDIVLACEDIHTSANGALRRIKDTCIRLMEAHP